MCISGISHRLLSQLLPFIAGQGARVVMLLTVTSFQLTAADAPTPMPEPLRQALGEVQQMLVDKQFSEAALRLTELKEKHPDVADVFNLLGSLHLTAEIRDPEAAHLAFNRALGLRPTELAPQFNLAELAFVTGEWETALKRFDEVFTAFPKMPLNVRHLVLVKIVVCHLKLQANAKAEALIAEHLTFMDDTPAYYFAKAAVAYGKEKEAEATEWLAKSKFIFGDRDGAPYLDTLMEARWVPRIGLSRTP